MGMLRVEAISVFRIRCWNAPLAPIANVGLFEIHGGGFPGEGVVDPEDCGDGTAVAVDVQGLLRGVSRVAGIKVDAP